MDTYEMKYKNALEWARQVVNGETGFIRKEVEDVFPELKESEDERIRKALMWFVERFPYDRLDNNGVSAKEALAWLEKQARSTTIIISEDLKGTDTDGGVVGEKGEQGKKSVWTEEDEELLQHCCGAVAAADYYTLEDKKEMENWLISLKQRGQQ